MAVLKVGRVYNFLHLEWGATRLEFYLKNAKDRDVKLVLFGEYVLNHFFFTSLPPPRPPPTVSHGRQKSILNLKGFEKLIWIIVIVD